jgi:hypothetical protein
MNKHDEGFEYWRGKFTELSDAKLKVGIFIETQISAVINDDLFEHLLAESEKPV